MVRRKLRNIDQVDTVVTENGSTNGGGARTDDGEFMRGLNDIWDENENGHADGHGQEQAEAIQYEVDMID